MFLPEQRARKSSPLALAFALHACAGTPPTTTDASGDFPTPIDVTALEASALDATDASQSDLAFADAPSSDSPAADIVATDILATDAANADAQARDSSTADVAPDALAHDAASSLSWRAPLFDGRTGYVEIPDNDAWSQPTTGALSVEAWMRPDSLAMPNREGSGYVHWMGKGASDQHEWVARMYQQGNSEARANRISFYAFNLSGGLGAGSYFEDTVVVGDWVHVVGAIDATQTHIYKNGAPRDSDLLSGYDIHPMNGTAPVRIGTRDLGSFFEGSIARVAIFRARLSDAQVIAHYRARATGDYDRVVLAEPSLVGFWRLDETTGTVAMDAVAGRHGRYVGGVMPGAALFNVP